MAWLVLVLVAAYGLAARCIHLLNENHYLLSPDSYFFHWAARGVQAGTSPATSPGGETPYALHSGLTYPLAYVARTVSAFGVDAGAALDVVCHLAPLLLALLGGGVLYWAMRRLGGRGAALGAVFAWASANLAIFITSPGYVDRDGLSILLVMAGAFGFYLALEHGPRPTWLFAGLTLLAAEGLLYASWGLMGVIVLLVIVNAYGLSRLVLQPQRRLRLLALLVAGNVLGAACVLITYSPRGAIAGLVGGGGTAVATSTIGSSLVAELSPIGASSLVGLWFLWIPVAAGLYVAWSRRHGLGLFVAVWFVALLALSFLAGRFFIYALPAACCLAGLGFAQLWVWLKGRRWTQTAFALLLCAIVGTTIAGQATVDDSRMTPDADWQEALAWLRSESPENAVVMAWWDYGYWILDVGERQPFVDNGYYGKDATRLQAVATVLTAENGEAAAALMADAGADYLIVNGGLRELAPSLERHSDGEFGEFGESSLAVRALCGQAIPQFARVFETDSVVILSPIGRD